MNLLQRIQSTIQVGARAPGLRHFVESSFEREFVGNRDRNMFLGVFDSYEAAAAQAARYGVSGYDNDASAELYLAHLRPDAHDYPAMFWFSKFFATGLHRVVDLGGNVGVKFHAYRKAVPLPHNVDWTVIDVPAVVAKGRAIAAGQGGVDGLHFTDDPVVRGPTDILFASGSLQYLPYTLGDCLRAWSSLPRCILINRSPIHPDTAYFTVNSIGTALCPYRVQTQAGLLSGLTALGYTVRDTWANLGKALDLPMQPELSLDHYRGFCLELAA